LNATRIEGHAGSLSNRAHCQRQVRVERAPELRPGFAGTVERPVGACRTDVPPDRLEVLRKIGAGRGLDGLGHLREKAEQSAVGGFLKSTLPVYGMIAANATNPASDNGFQLS
jgi:hypothetical protein